MSEQIIEVAIRSPKKGRSESEFRDKMAKAVTALLQVDGVGPERAFSAFATEPAQDRMPAVGMTRYVSLRHQQKATRNLGVLWHFLGFLRVMDLHVNVFLRPDEAGFDLSTFAREPGTVVEFTAITPAPHVPQAEFLAARDRFLAFINGHDEVLGSHSFTTAGGFKAKDSIVHIIEYRDRAAFDALGARLQHASEPGDFRRTCGAAVTVIASADGAGARDHA